jgi:hypothetical protein
VEKIVFPRLIHHPTVDKNLKFVIVKSRRDFSPKI